MMAFWIALGIAVVMVLALPLVVAARRGFWHSTSRDASAWAHAWWAVLFMALFMAFTSTATLSYTDPRDYNATGKVDLQAMSSPTSTEGNFFLASGTVDEELVYRYLIRDADGFIMREEVPSHRAWVIEEETEPAYLEYRWNCNTWVYPWGACQRPAYVFHVPLGSVLNEYVVAP